MGIVSARRAGATVSVAGLLWLIVLCFTGSEQCVQSKFDVPNDQEASGENPIKQIYHIELFHWGSGYTSIRLLTEFAQFAKEKGERDPPQKPARGGLVLPFRTVKWQETQDSSQRSVEPPPTAASTQSCGSFLHVPRPQSVSNVLVLAAHGGVRKGGWPPLQPSASHTRRSSFLPHPGPRVSPEHLTQGERHRPERRMVQPPPLRGLGRLATSLLYETIRRIDASKIVTYSKYLK